MLFGVDPGVKGMAWGVLDSATNLYACGVVKRPPTPDFCQPEPEAVAAAAIADIDAAMPAARAHLTRGVVERMVAYPPKTSKDMGKATKVSNDLLLLTASSGLVMGYYVGAKVTHLRPRTWKGTRPKEWTQIQVLKALSVEERRVLDLERYAPSYRHNLFDVVGLLLTHVGRIR